MKRRQYGYQNLYPFFFFFIPFLNICYFRLDNKSETRQCNMYTPQKIVVFHADLIPSSAKNVTILESEPSLHSLPPNITHLYILVCILFLIISPYLGRKERKEGEGVREEGEKQEGWERGVINGRNPNNNYLGTVQPSH